LNSTNIYWCMSSTDVVSKDSVLVVQHMANNFE
jgi:hypothetical protein